MAEAAVSMAVEKLGNLAIQKASELRRVEEQVMQLKDELQMMQCFLRDAAEKQAKEETVRKWISDVREVAFDAEDVIDTFSLKVDEPRKSSGLVERCVGLPKHVYHLDKLRLEIESIQKRLKEIEERRVRFGIQNILNEAPIVSSDIDRRHRVSPWHKDKHVVGLEKHVEVLLQEVVFVEKEGLSIASIVGMGGVGKSTLAKTIYNHAAVGERFDHRAWVSVSRKFNSKELLKELVRQLRPRGGELTSMESLSFQASLNNLSEESIECMVQEHLRGKRYFIVLDDVWQPQDWEWIVKVLPDEGRLLITSRIDNILSMDDGHVHKLECLDLERSWKLFLTSIDCPKELEDIGKEIVKKCHGLPLAITVMAGVLLGQGKSARAWEQVHKGMGSNLETRENWLPSVLELSYWDLPPNLKSCFLCLSFFKEDALIDARALIKLWIAEGIIPQGNGKVTMEEIAKCYLGELINRNMVQSTKLTKDGAVKYCQIHDLLRDLSFKKATEEVRFNILNVENVSNQSLDKTRHLSVYHNNESFMSSRSSIPRLRSLFLHVSTNGDDGNPVNIWERLEGCIRVLELKGLGLTMVPKRIGTLVGLRYLQLCNNYIEKLPRSLGHLIHLQTLDISGNDSVILVPNILWKLDSLRHLYMPQYVICKKPLKLDTLRNLQTLYNVSTENIVVEHLAKMVSLCDLNLHLWRDFEVSELISLLAGLENLVYLGLNWKPEQELSLDGLAKLQHITRLHIFGRLAKLPKSFPQKLSYLKLYFTNLKEDPMPMLGMLPNLSYLKLHQCSYVGEDMEIVCNGFPRLEVLTLVYLPEMRQIFIKKWGTAKAQRIENLSLQKYKYPSRRGREESGE